jgi:hypothetical protein
VTAGKLRHTIVVRHPETMVATALVAGSAVPEWADGLVHADDLSEQEKKAPAARRKPASVDE